MNASVNLELDSRAAKTAERACGKCGATVAWLRSHVLLVTLSLVYGCSMSNDGDAAFQVALVSYNSNILIWNGAWQIPKPMQVIVPALDPATLGARAKVEER